MCLRRLRYAYVVVVKESEGGKEVAKDGRSKWRFNVSHFLEKGSIDCVCTIVTPDYTAQQLASQLTFSLITQHQ